MKSLFSVLDVKTNGIHHTVSTGQRARDRLFVVNIRSDRLKLRIIDSKRRINPVRMPRCNPNRKPTPAKAPDDAAAEKPGSTEHDDGALVRDRHSCLSQSRSRSVLNDNASAHLPGLETCPELIVVAGCADGAIPPSGNAIEILFAAVHERAFGPKPT